MDYNFLLNIKSNHLIIPILLIVGFLISILSLTEISFPESYKTVGVSENNIIYVNVPILYSDTFTNGEYLKIGSETFPYEVIEISDIKLDSDTLLNYQIFSIRIDKFFKDNEVVNLTVYYKRDKIINKIKEHL